MCSLPVWPAGGQRIRACFGVLAMTICVACGETRLGQLEQLVSDPLDPNAHRAHIVAVDAILFEDGGLGETDRKQLAETLLALGKVASADAKHVIASNANIGRQLRALATAAERTRAGTPLLNSPLRQQWLRLRGSLFDDAWWFRHSSTDPVAPAIAPPEAPSGLRAANGEERTGLDLTLSSLSDLVARAKEDLPNGLDSDPHRAIRERCGAPAHGGHRAIGTGATGVRN